MIKYFYDHFWWFLGYGLSHAVYVDALVDQGLIPGGAQRFVQFLCRLTMV